MSVDRKAIANAILALLMPDNTIYKNQNPMRFKFIDEVTAAEVPALYLTWDGDPQVSQSQNFAGAKIIEEYMVHVYEDGGSNDPTATPVLTIFDRVKAIEDAIRQQKVNGVLVPLPDGFRQTLGGLVESCVIEGAIKSDKGMLGSKSFAMIPIRVVVSD